MTEGAKGVQMSAAAQLWALAETASPITPWLPLGAGLPASCVSQPGFASLAI